MLVSAMLKIVNGFHRRVEPAAKCYIVRVLEIHWVEGVRRDLRIFESGDFGRIEPVDFIDCAGQ